MLRRTALVLVMGFAASAGLAGGGENADLAALKAQALASTRKALDPVLKAPATARYAVSDVSKMEPSAVLVQGRYRVEMTVDAQNAFGVPLRAKAQADYKQDGGAWRLLRFVYTSPGDDPRVIYNAPASETTRPEVIKYIRDDFNRRRETLEKLKAGKKVGIVPRNKPKNGKKMSKNEYDAEALLTAKTAVTHYREKFGLDAEDCMDILGIK